MILIADGGSTKIDWALLREGGECIKGGEEVSQFKSSGVNPLFLTEEEIVKVLTKEISPHLNFSEVTKLYFYGAGVACEREVERMESSFKQLFRDASLSIYSDILGAARALSQRERGIISILGTGSNCSLYDGERVIDAIPAGGFILGDEGSGAYMGRKLLSDYFKRVMEEPFRSIFEREVAKKYGESALSYGEVVGKIYRGENPNRYLASFAPLLRENISIPYVYQLVKSSIKAFFRRNIIHFTGEGEVAHFVGSIAYHFSDIVKEVAKEERVAVGRIVSSPIEGLIEYHLS